MRKNATTTDYRNVRVAAVKVMKTRKDTLWATAVVPQYDENDAWQSNIYVQSFDEVAIRALVRFAKKVTNEAGVEFHETGETGPSLVLTAALVSNNVEKDGVSKWFHNIEVVDIHETPAPAPAPTARKRAAKSATA